MVQRVGTTDEQEARRRASLAQTVMAVLDGWGVPPAQQVHLLGLPEGTRARMLIRYRNGSPLPEDEGVMRRARCILGIFHALQNMYPHSAIAADHWVTSPNPRFKHQTPLDLMLNQGLSAMERMLEQLEGSADWS
jgi:hypothetical protein